MSYCVRRTPLTVGLAMCLICCATQDAQHMVIRVIQKYFKIILALSYATISPK